MKLNKIKLASILLAGATFGGFGAHAKTDTELLNTLVHKGYLTKHEAASMNHAGSTDFSAAGESTTSLRFNGMLQMQWNYLAASSKTPSRPAGVTADAKRVHDPVAQNNAQFRRLYLGVTADLMEDWSATINGDFAAGSRGNFARLTSKSSGASGSFAAAPSAAGDYAGGSSGVHGGTFKLEKGIITWHGMDEFTMHFGYMKVPFGYEETMDNAELKTIERSPMNRFFVNQLGYGARHTGVYLKGDLSEMDDMLDGLYYAFAVTDPRQGHVDGPGLFTSNSFAYWARLGFASSYDDVSFNVGINGGFIGDNRIGVPSGIGPVATMPAAGGTSDWVYGIYANMTWEDFSLMFEFMGASLESGKSTAALPTVGAGAPVPVGTAKPIGFTIMPSYRWEDFEFVFAYSYLASNGHGISSSNVMPGAPQSSVTAAAITPGATSTVGASASGVFVPVLFNKMHHFFVGGTWFIMGNDVTMTAGFEYGLFEDQIASFGGAPAFSSISEEDDVYGFRVRMQLLF